MDELVDEAKARARDESLRRTGALDGAAAVGLDKLVRLARFVAGSQFAAIHLLDGTLQYRIAEAGGLPLEKTPVGDSMCLPVVESEVPLYVPDARQHPFFADHPETNGPTPVRLFAAMPLRDDEGVAIGTLCVFDHDRVELDEERLQLLADLAEHVREHLHLHTQVRVLGHVASHDVLTGLPNRSLLSERLAQAMTRRQRRVGEPALAMIDLDGFKAINDSFGHQAGDEVLVQVGRRLVAAVREQDTVARLGGDEFMVLYAELPAVDTEELVEALRLRLGESLEEPYLVKGEPLHLGASVGFVRAGADELGYELLGRADQAMYERKAQRAAVSRASE